MKVSNQFQNRLSKYQMMEHLSKVRQWQDMGFDELETIFRLYKAGNCKGSNFSNNLYVSLIAAKRIELFIFNYKCINLYY